MFGDGDIALGDRLKQGGLLVTMTGRQGTGEAEETEMNETGARGGLNPAGARYGTGYCDAQCPKLPFINGVVSVFLSLYLFFLSAPFSSSPLAS